MAKTAGIIYRICAWVFVAGVVVQVFLAGMVVVALQISWGTHIALGHLIGLPALIMLATAYLGKASREIKRTTWLLFAVFFFQSEVIIFWRQSAPLISAFHPVLALIDFWLGLSLARQSAQGLSVAQMAKAG